MKFILASQNAHKAEEFAAAIKNIVVIPAPHSVDVDENAESFIGNAEIKARAYADAFHCNALADDSGLCVDALNGKPGVYSQRFAIMPPDVDNDPDRTAANNRKLLNCLKNVPDSKRGAHFACALCLVIVEPDDIERMKNLAEKLDNHSRSSIRFFDDDNREVSWDNPNIIRAELAFERQAFGYILFESHGNGGFGYDPLFYCPDTRCSFAELTREQKLSVSHRGRAIAALKEWFE